MDRSRVRHTLAIVLGTSLLGACASTPPPDNATLFSDRSNDIVILADGDGIGTSWSSITDSPLTRTATELSNIGGAPVVLGAVGIILAADAAPKGRASRLAAGLEAETPPHALDAELKAEIETLMVSSDADSPDIDIRVETLERPRDFVNQGYIVETEYALSKTGDALRVTANVVHADVLRIRNEMERELRNIEMSQTSYSYATGTRSGRYNRKLRRLQQELSALPPYYRGTFEYHSDRLDLPSIDTLDPNDAETKRALRTALDTEREARRFAAQIAFDAKMAAAETPQQTRKAQRRLDKALSKAESLYTKSLKKLEDDEVEKMEGLILSLDAWRRETSGNDGISELDAAIDEAHNFLAQAIGATLIGLPIYDDPDPEETRPVLTSAGARILQKEPNGRTVILMTEGLEAGTLLSLPKEGSSEYGLSVAQP